MTKTKNMRRLTRACLVGILSLGLLSIPTSASALDTCDVIRLPLCVEIGSVPVPPSLRPTEPAIPPAPRPRPGPVDKSTDSQPKPDEVRDGVGIVSSRNVTQGNEANPSGSAGSTRVIIRERVVTTEKYDTDSLLWSLLIFLGVGMGASYLIGFKRSHDLTVKRLHEQIRPKK